jgi:hypothetical protein
MSEQRKKERRSTTLIKKNFQSKFLRLIVFSLIAFMILAMVMFYITLRIKINQAGFSGYTQERLAETFTWLNWVLPGITLILIIIATIWGKHISFKIAGPLYALEKQLNMLIENKTEKVQLRSSDDNEVIPLANLINELIEKRIKQEDKNG